jgi:hypothetical protein
LAASRRESAVDCITASPLFSPSSYPLFLDTLYHLHRSNICGGVSQVFLVTLDQIGTLIRDANGTERKFSADEHDSSAIRPFALERDKALTPIEIIN